MTNRKLEFRAWDTIRKEWMEFVPPREYMIDSQIWDHRDMEEASLRYPKNLFYHFNNRIVYQQFIEMDEQIPMFEGDIISVDDDGAYEIVYENGSFGIYMDEFSFEPLCNLTTHLIKVLGNVCENPDLI